MPPNANHNDSANDPRENIICFGNPSDTMMVGSSSSNNNNNNNNQGETQNTTSSKQSQSRHRKREKGQSKKHTDKTRTLPSNIHTTNSNHHTKRHSKTAAATKGRYHRKNNNNNKKIHNKYLNSSSSEELESNIINHNHFKNLQENGMATALSIDHWHPPESSKCEYKTAPELSVNFICMHPQTESCSSSEEASCPPPPPPPPPPNKTTAARFQEIFIDMVGMYCASYDASSRHILDERFHTFLGKGERDFKNAVLDLMTNLSLNEDAKHTSAYEVLERSLKTKMGYRNTYFWSNRKKYKRRYSDSSWNANNNATTTPHNEDTVTNNCTSQSTNASRPNKTALDYKSYSAAVAATATSERTHTTDNIHNHNNTLFSFSGGVSSSTCSSTTNSVILDSEDEDHHHLSYHETSNENNNNDIVTSPTKMMMDPVQLKLERLDERLQMIEEDIHLVRCLGFCGCSYKKGDASYTTKERLASILRNNSSTQLLFDKSEIEELLELLFLEEEKEDSRTDNDYDGAEQKKEDNKDIVGDDNDQEEDQEEEDQHHSTHVPNPLYAQLQKRFCKLLQPPGHVFVCTASVCDLHCDAFLCPGAISDRSDVIMGTIWKQWKSNTLNKHPWLKQKLKASSFSSSSDKNESPQKQHMVFQRYKQNLKKEDDSNNNNNKTNYDRIVTYKHWPWKEFADKNNNAVIPVPFFVGGEVSLEKSLARTANNQKGANYSNSEQNNRDSSSKNNNNKKKKHSNRNHRSGKNKLPPEEEHIQALMETVRQFIAVSLDELRLNQPKPQAGRERYLLAIPVLGTGGGFAGDLTGQIVERLLHLLSDQVAMEDDLDMVLVCADEATYAHAQTIRSNIVADIASQETDGDLDYWGENHEEADIKETTSALKVTLTSSSSSQMFPCFQWLAPKTRNYAQQLAESASSDHLALFLGAGVSMGSGLPSWLRLLHDMEDLFTPSGVPEERTLGESCNWDRLLMADKLDEMCATRFDRCGTKMDLKTRICTYIDEQAQHPGLLLSLLTSLPCKSIVTQNYDLLIERSIECWNVADPFAKKALSVIPYRPQRGAHNWLLKMHGCVTAPQDIIITGKDYTEFHDNPALAGLMQASLMTKHLLFVGFSLSDPNYLDTIDQVRHALHVPSDTNNI